MSISSAIGYQLLDEHDRPPDEFTTFEILSYTTLQAVLTDQPQLRERYRVVEIHNGDIEDPTFI